MKTIDSPRRRLTNANYMFWARNAALMSSSLRTLGFPVKLASALTLLTYGMLLGGCAATGPAPLLPSEPSPPLVLSQPLPAVRYSDSTKILLESQRLRLSDYLKRQTATSPTSKP